MNIADLKKDVAQLPSQDQATLAQWIITNLDSANEDVDAAWRKEVRSRVKEIKTGKVEMIESQHMWEDLLSSHEATS